MTGYQVKSGFVGRYAGDTLSSARLTAIKVLNEEKHTAFVGVFGNSSDTVKTLYGRVGRTNTIYYTWEIPTKNGYELKNFLNKEGKIVHPAQWFYHDGHFYY